MCHRVAGHAVYSRCRVYLLDAVHTAEVLCRHLSRGGFLSRADRRKGEDAPRSHAQNAADDSLFPHAQADQRMLVTLLFQELHHHHVVRQGGSRGDDLVEVGGVGKHLLQSFFQLAGGTEVVKGEDQSCPTTQFL